MKEKQPSRREGLGILAIGIGILCLLVLLFSAQFLEDPAPIRGDTTNYEIKLPQMILFVVVCIFVIIGGIVVTIFGEDNKKKSER